MAYSNLPPSLQEIFYRIADRVAKLETGPNQAMYKAAAAQTDAATALADAQLALAEAADAYNLASTAIQGSTNTVLNAQNQLTAINGNGITVYAGSSSTSGARVVLNSSGIAGFNVYGSTTFAIDATNGNVSITGASFTSGTINGGSLNINGNAIIDTNGLLTAYGATITGTITSDNISANGGNIGGFTINNSAGNRYLYYGSTYLFGSASSGYQTNGNTTTQWAIVDNARDVYFNGVGAGNNGFFTVSGPIATNNGNISTTTGAVSVGGRTSLFSDGSIFANTLGTTTGTPNIRQASGYLRFTASSSQRYKNSIVDLKDVSELDPYKLLDIPVRAFKYNEGYVPDTDERYDVLIPGFIAEEVEEVYPVAVDYNEGQTETWVSNYIVPGMLDLIKDMNTRLNALEGR
jgi:hypothetical protein